MRFPVATRIIYQGGPILAARGAKKIYQDEARGIIQKWHRGGYLKRHFKQSAIARYNYAKRSRRTRLRSYVVTGGFLPLVFTGRLFTSATRYIRIRSTARRATGTMTVPSYVKFRPNYPGHPVLGHELTRVTGQEIRELVNAAERNATQRFNEIKGRVVVELQAAS